MSCCVCLFWQARTKCARSETCAKRQRALQHASPAPGDLLKQSLNPLPFTDIYLEVRKSQPCFLGSSSRHSAKQSRSARQLPISFSPAGERAKPKTVQK